MAEHISMKQVPGGIVTATDDRILYDYLVNSGIVYGCEISYLGNNMIHINAGYGIIKGGLFEIEDHTEYVDYAESGAVNGQIYIHFDAAADDKIKIVKETSANPHQMIQNEDANFENGIYEIQLCTFRATTTALTLVRQTFVKSVMPIDVLDTLEAIEANTEANKAAGALALKALKNKVSSKGEATLLANVTTKTAQTITIDNLNNYKMLSVSLIYFNRIVDSRIVPISALSANLTIDLFFFGYDGNYANVVSTYSTLTYKSPTSITTEIRGNNLTMLIYGIK